MGTGLYRILKERTGKLNFMQMVKGRKYRNARFYRSVDMVRSAGK